MRYSKSVVNVTNHSGTKLGGAAGVGTDYGHFAARDLPGRATREASPSHLSSTYAIIWQWDRLPILWGSKYASMHGDILHHQS